ncbi:hypothetical protein [Flammeovirga aprica]|uniref:Uncharacterized protein n=1 Tax=Flammeovirga aprica JL-4 TaxID=694437 RepID=A0A7X9RXR0_9BACT|nr:hypothetical protein [Flammeovirga aprica]NME70612.1 hypothetical protein [Flammeovirga aprica JL-4]
MMLQEKLKKYGQKMNQIKFILLGLGVLNFILMDIELATFSEKVITTLMSSIYVFAALRAQNMKDTLFLILTIVLVSNVMIGILDMDFFIRQSLGSLVEVVVLSYQLMGLIKEEKVIDKISVND